MAQFPVQAQRVIFWAGCSIVRSLWLPAFHLIVVIPQKGLSSARQALKGPVALVHLIILHNCLIQFHYQAVLAVEHGCLIPLQPPAVFKRACLFMDWRAETRSVLCGTSSLLVSNCIAQADHPLPPAPAGTFTACHVGMAVAAFSAGWDLRAQEPRPLYLRECVHNLPPGHAFTIASTEAQDLHTQDLHTHFLTQFHLSQVYRMPCGHAHHCKGFERPHPAPPATSPAPHHGKPYGLPHFPHVRSGSCFSSKASQWTVCHAS